jgi:hypothetical protein
MQKVFFKEEQKFSNPVLWIFTAIAFTIAVTQEVIAIFKQTNLTQPVEKGDESLNSMILSLLIIVVIFIAVMILFGKMKLVIEVRSDGIFYRYLPFIRRMRSFHRNEISSFEVRSYRPIKEFRGHGIKRSRRGTGRSFTVKGKIGLQLNLTNGKKVLLGTQRGDALKRAMQRMMKEE